MFLEYDRAPERRYPLAIEEAYAATCYVTEHPFYPVTNADFETGWDKQFANGPWLTRLAMQWFWDQSPGDQALKVGQTISKELSSFGFGRGSLLDQSCDSLRL